MARLAAAVKVAKMGLDSCNRMNTSARPPVSAGIHSRCGLEH